VEVELDQRAQEQEQEQQTLEGWDKQFQVKKKVAVLEQQQVRILPTSNCSLRLVDFHN